MYYLNNLEIMNEFCIFIITHLLFAFTDYNPNQTLIAQQHYFSRDASQNSVAALQQRLEQEQQLKQQLDQYIREIDKCIEWLQNS